MLSPQDNIGGIREQILANAQLLFHKHIEAHEDRPQAFNIALFRTTNMPAAGSPHQAILYYLSEATPDTAGTAGTPGETMAEGPPGASEHAALAGLLGLLSEKLGERRDEVLSGIDAGSREAGPWFAGGAVNRKFLGWV